jgi:hypothetical protein
MDGPLTGDASRAACKLLTNICDKLRCGPSDPDFKAVPLLQSRYYEQHSRPKVSFVEEVGPEKISLM